MAETTTFRESVKTICPSWLQGFWGYRFMYNCATHIDAVSEALKQGVLARMPGYGTREALPFIGHDRQILRGFQETDAAYIARLQQAIPTWKVAGNPYAIIGQLAGYVSPFVPTIRYVVNGQDDQGDGFSDWITLQAGSTTYTRAQPRDWDWFGSDPGDFHFWIILYILNAPATGLILPKNWGTWTWGDGSSWGSTATQALVGDIRSIVSKWKASGSDCTNIIVVHNDPSNIWVPGGGGTAPFPAGNWYDFRQRWNGALYWDGVK